MKDSATDVGLYWTTLRVFTKKLETLLNDLANDATWTTVKAGWSNEREELVVRDEWTMGLHSTTNTLAALLKVPLKVDTRFERRVSRDQTEEPERLAFARHLLALSRDLLVGFDAASST